MGTYNIDVEEIVDEFEDFLMSQEGDISADVIAGAWNQLCKKWGWGDLLRTCKKEKGE